MHTYYIGKNSDNLSMSSSFLLYNNMVNIITKLNILFFYTVLFGPL